MIIIEELDIFGKKFSLSVYCYWIFNFLFFVIIIMKILFNLNRGNFFIFLIKCMGFFVYVKLD